MNKKKKDNEPVCKNKFTDVIEKVHKHLLKKIITVEQLEQFLKKYQKKY